MQTNESPFNETESPYAEIPNNANGDVVIDDTITFEDSQDIPVMSKRGSKNIVERQGRQRPKYKAKYTQQGSDNSQTGIQDGAIWTRYGRVICRPKRLTY